ncbi:MAG: hypothetical protein AAFW73_23910 [Bacteroidota bacterium]
MRIPIRKSKSSVLTLFLVLAFLFQYSTALSQVFNETLGSESGGSTTGNNITIGVRNVLLGDFAGDALNNESGSVLIGYRAGLVINTSQQVFIGKDAGFDNITGSDNTFAGNGVGFNNLSGSGNTFIGGPGDDFLENTIYDRFAVGTGAAGNDNESGNFNTCIGAAAGADFASANANTFVGYSAGGQTENAGECTFVGAFAGWDNNRTNRTDNALRNNYFGFAAGGTNREGSDNIGIGHDADFRHHQGLGKVFSRQGRGHQSAVCSAGHSSNQRGAGISNPASPGGTGLSQSTGILATLLAPGPGRTHGRGSPLRLSTGMSRIGSGWHQY